MMIAVIILITIGSGCATEVRYISQPLPLPARPVLDSVTEHELSVLPPDVYRRLKNRDRERKQYAEELETIIKSTHSQKKK
jgi:hypothetical protein